MKWRYLVIGIVLVIILISLSLVEFFIVNSIYWSFLISVGVLLNFAHILTHKFNWELDTKKVLSIYFTLSTALMVIEFIITGTFLSQLCRFFL